MYTLYRVQIIMICRVKSSTKGDCWHYNSIFLNSWHAQITYARCIWNSDSRQRVFKLSSQLVDVCPSTNIIVTSAAVAISDLRAPYDISHLCTLMGLSPMSGKFVISTSPCNAIKCARMRRDGTSKCLPRIEFDIGEEMSE